MNLKYVKKNIPSPKPGILPKKRVIQSNFMSNDLPRIVVESADKETADGMIESHVSEDAVVNTDKSSIYNGVSKKRKHSKVNHSARVFVDGMASTNGIESVWSVLKRMFYGTYHQFSKKHLQRHVDECTFRLNDGRCKNHVWNRMIFPSSQSWFCMRSST